MLRLRKPSTHLEQPSSMLWHHAQEAGDTKHPILQTSASLQLRPATGLSSRLLTVNGSSTTSLRRSFRSKTSSRHRDVSSIFSSLKMKAFLHSTRKRSTDAGKNCSLGVRDSYIYIMITGRYLMVTPCYYALLFFIFILLLLQPFYF